MLWTGGKDSSLALYEAHLLGYEITHLATFVPTEKPEFLAHPVSFMKYQAEALGLPISRWKSLNLSRKLRKSHPALKRKIRSNRLDNRRYRGSQRRP